MITTFLVAHPWLTTLGLLLLVGLGPLAGRTLVGRPSLALRLAGLAAVPVVLLTLVPTARELPVTCVVEWALPTLGRVELMANVILFAPPVLLLAVAWRAPVAAFVVGSVGSVAIEAVQAVVPALGRSCSTQDWLSNSIGAALGAALAAVALAATSAERSGSPAARAHTTRR